MVWKEADQSSISFLGSIFSSVSHPPYVYHFLSFQPTKRNLKSSNSFKESIFKKKKKRWCRGEWWWSDEYIFDGIFWKNLNTEGTLEEPKNQTWMNIIALPLN